jgi:hypothetical protein
MSIPLKDLLKLANSNDIEVKQAAIKVIGELGIKNEEAITTLKELTKDKAKSVRLFSLEALSKIKEPTTLSIIDKEIEQEDEYTQSILKKCYINYGSMAVDYIAKMWDQTSLEKKQHYLTILYSINLQKSYEIIVSCILSDNTPLTNYASKIWIENIYNINENLINYFIQKAKSFVKNIIKNKQEIERYLPALLNISKITRNIESSDSLSLLSTLTEINNPQVSTSIAQALIKLYKNEKLKEKHTEDFIELFKHIFELTKKTQLENISEIYAQLYEIDLPHKLFKYAINLYENTSIFEVKKWVISFVSRNTSDMGIEFLIKNLYSENNQIRAEVFSALKRNPSLSNTLIKELYKSKEPEVANQLVEVIKSYKIIWPTEKVKEFIEIGIKKLQQCAQNGKKKELNFAIAKGLLELAGQIALELVRGKLLEQIIACKETKNFSFAELIFQILNSPMFATYDTRFEFAIFKLLTYDPQILSQQKLYISSLEILSELLKIPRFNIGERLKAEKRYLQAGHYLYIAEHFIKGLPPERTFAKDILRFITTSYPKTNKVVKIAEELLASAI